MLGALGSDYLGALCCLGSHPSTRNIRSQAAKVPAVRGLAPYAIFQAYSQPSRQMAGKLAGGMAARLDG